MSRAIGKNVRLVCEAAEAGRVNYREVQQMTGQTLCNIPRYAKRAEEFGLLAIDRTTTPATYSACPDWRVRVESPKRIEPVRPRPVNSVFEMGDRA